MPSNIFVVVLMAVGIFSGMANPFFLFTARAMIVTLAPPLLIAGPTIVLFLSSLIAATMTLILAGIPAALFERATGRTETDAASYAVWIVSAAALVFLGLR